MCYPWLIEKHSAKSDYPYFVVSGYPYFVVSGYPYFVV